MRDTLLVQVTAPLVAALALAACGELPKPFAHQGPTDNALLLLEDSAGVVVAPPAGVPPETGARLARAVSEALGEANVPASVGGGNRDSFRLTGWATVRPVGSGREEIAIDWRLTDRGGTDRGKVAQRHPVPDGDRGIVAPEVVQGIAAEAAPRIADFIQDDAAIEAPPPAVFVAAVTGAPGNGNHALRRGMRNALANHAIRIVDREPGPDAFTVTARVAVGAAAGDGQEVRISWRVFDADGQEHATIDQANTVAAGSLKREWGAVADAVAGAAAEGISAALERVLLARARDRF